MRQDTKVLLSRLGEEGFKYYDFESPSLDVDVWPIFEALLLDDRVVGKIGYHATPSLPVRTEAAPVVREAERSGTFGSYAAQPAGKADADPDSVRGMLGRLASNQG